MPYSSSRLRPQMYRAGMAPAHHRAPSTLRAEGAIAGNPGMLGKLARLYSVGVPLFFATRARPTSVALVEPSPQKWLGAHRPEQKGELRASMSPYWPAGQLWQGVCPPTPQAPLGQYRKHTLVSRVTKPSGAGQTNSLCPIRTADTQFTGLNRGCVQAATRVAHGKRALSPVGARGQRTVACELSPWHKLLRDVACHSVGLHVENLQCGQLRQRRGQRPLQPIVLQLEARDS